MIFFSRANEGTMVCREEKCFHFVCFKKIILKIEYIIYDLFSVCLKEKATSAYGNLNRYAGNNGIPRNIFSFCIYVPDI